MKSHAIILAALSSSLALAKPHNLPYSQRHGHGHNPETTQSTDTTTWDYFDSPSTTTTSVSTPATTTWDYFNSGSGPTGGAVSSGYVYGPASTGTSGESGNGTSGGGNGKMPQAGIEMLQQLEGFRGDFYDDAEGVKTIGYGHACQYSPGSCDKLVTPISNAQGVELMKSDLVAFEKCTCQLENASKLTANQFGALVSFAYNRGCEELSSFQGALSTAGAFAQICDMLPSTLTLGGLLTSRREVEAKLCKTATSFMSGCGSSSDSGSDSGSDGYGASTTSSTSLYRPTITAVAAEDGYSKQY